MPINRSIRTGKKTKKQVSRSKTWLKRVAFHPFIKAQTSKKGRIYKEIRKKNAVYLCIQKHPPNIKIKVQKTFTKCCLLFETSSERLDQKSRLKEVQLGVFQFCRGFKMKTEKQRLTVIRTPPLKWKSYIFRVN